MKNQNLPFYIELDIKDDEFNRRMLKNMFLSGEPHNAKLTHLKNYKCQKKGDKIFVRRRLDSANAVDAELEAKIKKQNKKIIIEGFVRPCRGQYLLRIMILIGFAVPVLSEFFVFNYSNYPSIFGVFYLIFIIGIITLSYYQIKRTIKSLEADLKKEFKSWTLPEKNYF